MIFKGLFFFLMLVVSVFGVCELPKSVGPCRAKIQRWFYSGGACEVFSYSGCGGNENNFKTKESCEQTCVKKANEPDSGVCELPKSVGPCRANLERWYYSGGACEVFSYSGCGGNENNFETRENCEQSCVKKANKLDSGVCELPKSVGPCRANLERWYYSGGACEVFSYSGCGGNENNFETRENCEQTCVKKANKLDSGVCELPKSVGPCRALLKRWFYSGGACEVFSYSGCGGNENNFETKESCEQTCVKRANVPDIVEEEDPSEDISEYCEE